MHQQVIIDPSDIKIPVDTLSDPPWIRFDACEFIWEEMLFKGNYSSVHCSAMGRPISRQGAYGKLNGRFSKSHLYGFELEINGQLLRDHWEWVAHSVVKTAAGCEESIIELTYGLFPVTVRLHTLLDGTSFITRWIEVENKAQEAFAISGISTLSGVIFSEGTGQSLDFECFDPKYSLGTYDRSYAFAEGEFRWENLSKGTLRMESERSFYNPPLFVIRNNSSGELFVLHLEGSVNMQIEFTVCGDYRSQSHIGGSYENYLHLRTGLQRNAAFRILEPGQVATSMTVHFSALYGTLDDCTNRLFDHLRNSVLPKQPPENANLVEYNHCGYSNCARIEKEQLIEEVEMAASLGAEIFTVDAGWFGEGNWWDVMGDWEENSLIRGHFEDIFNHVRRKGMKCGLWLPIENVSLTSEFARTHPDWLVTRRGEKGGCLDITKPEVENYMIEKVSDIISRYKLDVWRIDGGLTANIERPAGRYIESTMWQYYEILYKFYEKIRARFPGLLMENCCGGGGRLDLGIMRHFHWSTMTDNLRPDQQIKILNGVTLGLPPEACMYIMGAVDMHANDLNFVIRPGLFGHYCISGLAPSVNKINLACLEAWKHTIDLYKNDIRPMLSACKVFHHTPLQLFRESGDWVVLEYADQTGLKALAGFFRLAGSCEFRFISRGLDISKEYMVYFDNLRKSVRISGYELCSKGIVITVGSTMASELLLIKSI